MNIMDLGRIYIAIGLIFIVLMLKIFFVWVFNSPYTKIKLIKLIGWDLSSSSTGLCISSFFSESSFLKLIRIEIEREYGTDYGHFASGVFLSVFAILLVMAIIFRYCKMEAEPDKRIWTVFSWTLGFVMFTGASLMAFGELKNAGSI